MRDAFKYLTSIIFAAVVVQVALAGYGAFYAVDKADDNDSVSKAAIDHGFNAHAIVGTLIVVVMLLLLIVAVAGRLRGRWGRC
jgi:heme/copper-type cytochrome/quinol oxidase subunit 2